MPPEVQAHAPTAAPKTSTVHADELGSWVRELLDLAEQFAAPLHFTPMHLGVSCALVFLSTLPLRDAYGAAPTERTEEQLYLRQPALRALTMSDEMHTMRRSYYEAISDLYYLYDDFNDRQIHSRAALQMAGAEIVGLLKQTLEEDERRFPQASRRT